LSTHLLLEMSELVTQQQEKEEAEKKRIEVLRPKAESSRQLYGGQFACFFCFFPSLHSESPNVID